MRLPSGYGGIVKLKGNRRKPYLVRITKGYSEETGKQIYMYLGYFTKRNEALEALAEYNSSPYDITREKITFAEVFKKWSKEHFPKVSDSAIVNYNLAFKYCKAIHKTRFKDIRLHHLQGVIDDCGKAYPTRKMILALLNQLSNFALKNDIVEKKYSQFIDVGINEGKANRKPFTQEEIDKLFQYVDKLEFVDTVLIMIYSGLRVGELLDLKNENIHLEERYMIGGLKTKAGKDRIIPINRKIEPFIRKYYNPENEYLITNFKGNQMCYSNYRREKFDNIMEKLKMEHCPHECRHTFASLMNSANANKLCLKRIIGHSSQDITEDVYTHKTLQELIDTIDLI